MDIRYDGGVTTEEKCALLGTGVVSLNTHLQFRQNGFSQDGTSEDTFSKSGVDRGGQGEPRTVQAS